VKKHTGNDPVLVEPFDKDTYSISPDFISLMRSKGISVLIVTDFSLDQNTSLVGDLRKFLRVLIIDHHKLYEDLNQEGVALVKPQMFCDIDPSKYCSAKLAFDICSELVDLSDFDWLAASASIADVATKPWMGWLSDVFEKYDVEMNDDLFQTKLGLVAQVVNSALVIDPENIKECFRISYSALSPDDILESPLMEYKRMIDSELEFWLNEFADCERYGDLYIFMIDPKYNIKSTLSTILGLKYPDKTILVMDIKDGFVSVSARRNDQEVAVNRLLEKAIKGFHSANAGGHVPAAGARFLEKDLPLFRERVIEFGG
jgi:single-stranded DNA-specific DHH superfamily exonuclease